MLRKSAQRWGDKPAMLYPTKEGYKSLTYRELPDRVRTYAGVLEASAGAPML